MTNLIIGVFIAAARAAVAANPLHWHLAQEALRTVPPEHYEPDVAAALRRSRLFSWQLVPEERLN